MTDTPVPTTDTDEAKRQALRDRIEAAETRNAGRDFATQAKEADAQGLPKPR